MISLEDAVKAAKMYATRVYDANELRQLRVEEIETNPDSTEWRITLGWVEPAIKEIGQVGALGIFGGSNSKLEAIPRVYKTFNIDAASGNVKSMTMR